MSKKLALVILSAVSLSAAKAQQGVPTLTRKVTIGCESCGGVDQFGTIWDVSVALNGDVLVTDRDAPMLRRFDVNGKSTWAGGRKGKGPGEFMMPVRTTISLSGINVVDMTNSRLTELDAAGAVRMSVPVTALPTSVGANDRGDLALGLDDFGRTYKIVVRRPGEDALRPFFTFPGSMLNKSVALAADGSIAVALDGKTYEIRRVDPTGKVLTPIVRDIPPTRRTQEEEAELRQRMSRGMDMVAAEAKRANGGSGSANARVFSADELSLKPQIIADGLRYDSGGRLWVFTMRGDTHKSVFDVFSAAGGFLGSVTIPTRVSNFAISGGWLVTAGESEDGIPQVVLWAVK